MGGEKGFNVPSSALHPANDPVATEARLELAMEIAGLGTFERDVTTGWLNLSARAAEIYGVRSAMLWTEWLLGVDEEDRADLLSMKERVLTDPLLTDHEIAFRYHRPDGQERFIVKRFRVLRDEGGRPLRVVGVVADETERRAEELRASWLLAELQHRVKNVMAMVRSLARRTLENSHDLGSFFSHFDGRLNALARVQSALVRRVDEGLDVEELVWEELLQNTEEGDQAVVSGPAVRLHGPVAEYLALALHELAVNSVKFGALAGHGRVTVIWKVVPAGDEDRLQLNWHESGVPLIETYPARLGFGRQLIEQGLAYQLGAETAFSLEPGGLHCELVIPLTPAARKT
ncbi:PAS domain S-box protein [Phenylobacterium sp. LjRoot164]|uniref:sensor histidine kinase n=1 Tax=unclassified Phenylobacterium TaxID=2640670 RepID=UPI003ECC7860